MSLLDTDAEAWELLRKAVQEPQSAFRYPTLCSVDASNAPQARVVVLRNAAPNVRGLEFHTDTRSPKWQEFAERPAATVIAYCPVRQLQLRLSGTVELFSENSSRAENAWKALPPWTRKTYLGGPPGDYMSEPSKPLAPSNGPEQHLEGKQRFGVVLFTARSLDWCQLDSEGNQRAIFTYGEDGSLGSSQFVYP